jgi:hypothetical protein
MDIAIGSVNTSPETCYTKTQLPELRLDRGILQRKRCSATQIEGQFPPDATTQQLNQI